MGAADLGERGTTSASAFAAEPDSALFTTLVLFQPGHLPSNRNG